MTSIDPYAGARNGLHVVEDATSWIGRCDEWAGRGQWARTTVVEACEPLVFLQWVEDRLLLPRQERLRAIYNAQGFLGALYNLDQRERDDWMTARNHLVWQQGARFRAVREAERLYRAWGFAL